MRNIFLVCLGIYSFIFGFGFSLVRCLEKTLPPVELLEEYNPPISTQVYGKNGELIHEFYEQRRTPVELKKIPEIFVKTTLAIEDRKFDTHWGIDVFGIMRAAISNIIKGKVVQGASTITQQLARNLFLTQEITLIRKLKEALLAIRIESCYSKEQILNMYFNQIYYGNGAYGVQSASQGYFGKNISGLTLTELSLLAGLPMGPVKYSPFKHPSRALEQRASVLNTMIDMEIISKSDALRTKNAPLGVLPPTHEKIGAYFLEETRKWVVERFGSDVLYRGGISMYTTMDPELQKIADDCAKNGIERLTRIYEFESDTVSDSLQIALLAIDPKTGEILAMVGGRDFGKSMFNRTTQAKRQPGSSFKPFTWTKAIESGYTPSSIILDEPVVVTAGDTIYSPHNYDHKFLGPVTLRKGIAKSRNLVAIRLIMKIGPQKVMELAKKMGISSELEPVISLALGSNSVTLLDMATGFAILANTGIRVKPYMIKRILDKNGEILYENQSFGERVIKPQIAYIVTSMLESVLNEGTGVGVRYSGFNRIAAGKTGTTNDYSDAWFIGYTPSLLTCVWLGYDIPKRIMKGATGARFALPIWTEFMKKALEDKPAEPFSMPSGIVKRKICDVSGLLANKECPNQRDEFFIQGTEPTEFCNLHGPVEKTKFEKLDSRILREERF